MKHGKPYLIHAGDWHSFVGIYLEQTSSLLHAFSHVSKIDTKDADSWGKLAAGDEELRSSARYYHIPYGTVEAPVSIMAMPWKGETPMEFLGIEWEDDRETTE